MGSNQSSIKNQSSPELAATVSSLGAVYEMYSAVITENSITGAVLSELTDAEIPVFLEELGVSSVVHRKVFESHIKLLNDEPPVSVSALPSGDPVVDQKQLKTKVRELNKQFQKTCKLLNEVNAIAGYVPKSTTVTMSSSVSGGVGVEGSVFERMAEASRPNLHRMGSFSIEDVDICTICGEEKSRGIFCNQKKSGDQRHFTCIDCFSNYVRMCCEDVGKLKDKHYSICCPNQTPALGCTSECWESHRVTSALLAASDVTDSKAVLDLFVCALSAAADRANPVDDTAPMVAAIADAMCLRCPLRSCATLLDPRPDGCMAMRCAACGTHFCFLCLSMQEDRERCHAHVLTCSLNPNPGDYFTTPERFEKAHKSLQIKSIKEVFVRMAGVDESKWREEGGIVMRALDNARHLLRGSNLSVDRIIQDLNPLNAFDGYFEGLDCLETLTGLETSLDDEVTIMRGLEYLRIKCHPTCSDAENNRTLVGRNKGCELIMKIFERYTGNVDIFDKIANCVCCFTFTGDRNRDLLCNLGYVELCIDGLKEYSSNGNNELAVSNACGSIVNILNSPLGKQKVKSKACMVSLMKSISDMYAGKSAAEWSAKILTSLTS